MTVPIITRVSNVQSLNQSVKPFPPTTLSCSWSEILRENRSNPSICFSSFARELPQKSGAYYGLRIDTWADLKHYKYRKGRRLSDVGGNNFGKMRSYYLRWAEEKSSSINDS